MTLELDDLDYDAIQKAMAKRQSFRCWPDAASVQADIEVSDPLADGSNLAGLVIAEICRGWMELLDLPPRITDGDGWKDG